MSRRQAFALARLHWKKLAAIAASLTVVFGAIVSAHEAAMVIEPYIPVTQQQFRDAVDSVVDRAVLGATMAVERAMAPLVANQRDFKISLARNAVSIDDLKASTLRYRRPMLVMLVGENPNSEFLRESLADLDLAIALAQETQRADACELNQIIQPGFRC